MRLFAALREAAGAGRMEVDAGTVEEIVTALTDRFGPKFGEIARAGSVVVDGERATFDTELHGTENLPTLLCGAGADLRFGQVIGDRADRRPLSDLHLDVLNLLGVPVTSWGEGSIASTGVPLPIRV